MTQPGSPAPSVSLRNRRLRAARLWVNSLQSGAVDAATLTSLVWHWVPILAGVAPGSRDAERCAAALVDYLRGAVTALIFEHTADNLVPAAKARHALETVLAIQLAALRVATPEPVAMA